MGYSYFFESRIQNFQHRLFPDRWDTVWARLRNRTYMLGTTLYIQKRKIGAPLSRRISKLLRPVDRSRRAGRIWAATEDLVQASHLAVPRLQICMLMCTIVRGAQLNIEYDAASAKEEDRHTTMLNVERSGPSIAGQNFLTKVLQ